MIFFILKWMFLHCRLGIAIFEEFLPSMPSWPFFAFYIVFSIYWYGHSHGVNACEAFHTISELKMEKKSDKIKEHNSNLDSEHRDKLLQPYYRD